MATCGLGDLFKAPSFVRNVAVLASGTAAAQAIGLAVAPILTRLYDPNAFGVLGVFVGVLAVLGVAASWKYELAIVLPPEDRDAANLVAVCFLAVGITTVISLIGIAGIRFAADRYWGQELTWLLLLAPVAVLGSGIYQTLIYWATRTREFSGQSVSQVSRATTIGAFQVGAGFFGGTPAGLVMGRVIGEFAAVIVLGRLLSSYAERVRASISWSRMRDLARRHRRFPLFSTPQAVLESLSRNLPVFLLAVLFNPAVAGLYWLTFRVLQVPTALVGQAIRRVFYQAAVELYNKGERVFRIFGQTSAALFGLGLVPTGVLILFGPTLFELVFGAEWREAGVFAQWLIVWWFATFVSQPSIMLVPVFGLQRAYLLYEIVVAVLRAAAIGFGWLMGDPLTAVIAYAIVSAIVTVALIGFVGWAAAKSQGAEPSATGEQAPRPA